MSVEKLIFQTHSNDRLYLLYKQAIQAVRHRRRPGHLEELMKLHRFSLDKGIFPVVGAAGAAGFNDTTFRAGAGVGFFLPPIQEVVDFVLQIQIVMERSCSQRPGL